MASPLKQLPWELEEDILFRLPPRSLVRFRSVCQRWNALFKNKSFLNNHLSRSRPQFLLFLANAKKYSIDMINPNSIDPTIELHELPSFAFPFGGLFFYRTTITACDELLFYNDRNGLSWLWNPWLRQTKKIKHLISREFDFFGLGYDSSRPKKVYKILGYFDYLREEEYRRVAIYECATHVFKLIDSPGKNWLMCEAYKRRHLSLNGNLYWLALDVETKAYFIQSFDFSVDHFKPFCRLLPCQEDNPRDELVLAVFMGDGFSLLKQCYDSRKLEIWVTNKIDKEEVVWRKFMTLPTTTNFPKLRCPFYSTSYFIYDKILYICCYHDHTKVACIYIVREDLCKKIPIDSGIVKCRPCVYTPNLFPVP